MYAGSGYFKGSIITESTIEAIEIKTAVITGTNDGDYALKIRNENGATNSKAIKFYNLEADGKEENYFSLTKDKITIGPSTLLSIGVNTSIDDNGIISPYFRTSIKNEATLINNSQIGFLKAGLIGLKLLEDNTLSLEKEGQYITFNNDIISTIKRLSVKSDFDLWNIQFKKIQDKNGIIIGFDVEIEG